ncbi:hypothetical protein HDU83_007389 [Entophlyctis luteolus]|nr:hypothetical protein HDU83_007389 [Entophlyctis luteolus]
MCGRTALYCPDGVLERAAGTGVWANSSSYQRPPPNGNNKDAGKSSSNGQTRYRASFNNGPMRYLPVLVMREGSSSGPGLRKELSLTRWGIFNLSGILTINARDDTLLDSSSPSWNALRNSHRCAIPAQGFFEWYQKSENNQVPYFIHLDSFSLNKEAPKEESKPSDIMWFAGLYQPPELSPKPVDVAGCVIITTTSADSCMEWLHDRMPVIFQSEHDREMWLDPRIPFEKVSHLMQPLKTGLKWWDVDVSVNKIANDSISCIIPVRERTGTLHSFFGSAVVKPGEVKQESLDALNQVEASPTKRRMLAVSPKREASAEKSPEKRLKVELELIADRARLQRGYASLQDGRCHAESGRLADAECEEASGANIRGRVGSGLPKSSVKTMGVVFLVRLDGDGAPSDAKKYIRLPPPVPGRPYHLRFVIDAGSPAAVPGAVLETNCCEEGIPFRRTVLRRVPFNCADLSDAICEIPIHTPGVFEYSVNVDGIRARTGHFVVDPRLTVPGKEASRDKDILLPLDAVCVLTVIPKWMPHVSKWAAHFDSFAAAGYNMIHFAPLNTRGASNSPYSIYDQLSLSYDLFGSDKHMDESLREKQLHSMLQLARADYGILSITDVVWNHTAHNSAWLQEHPEAGYNLETAPHLRPAFELDEAIMELCTTLNDANISLELKTESHLTEIMKFFEGTILPGIRLWEFYVIDVNLALEEFKSLWNFAETFTGAGLNGASVKELAETLRKRGMPQVWHFSKRFSRKVDAAVAVSLIKQIADAGKSIEEASEIYVKVLNELNEEYYKEFDDDRETIINNIWNRARYLRLDPQGPNLGLISEHVPFVDTYFTRLPLTVATHKLHPDARCLANNGWIWNGDPLQNFAGPTSKSYLRREEDSPWLWNHQKAYTEKMARLFHGFRIDNCHSTPIHVAAYLLDAARVINPNLYVFAELFTGSEETDVHFVSKLGINSLIREAMSAWDVKELSRLVHRYGGTPIGSLALKEEYYPLDILGHDLGSNFYYPLPASETSVIDVKGSSTHALFMDCTHDNETPHQKRTAEDTLPTAALVAMTASAIGSVKGYDEIVPKLLNVVTETRKYRVAEAHEGIIPAKSVLLNIHSKMAREGYTEIHVHQEHDYISVHRMHPVTHDGYLLVARSAFSKYHGGDVHPPIILRDQSVHVIESAGLRVQAKAESPSMDDLKNPHGPHDSEAIAFSKDERARVHGRKTIGSITGLPCFLDFSAVLTTLMHSRVDTMPDGSFQTVLTVNGETFMPGSIVLYRTWMGGSGMNLVSPDFSASPLSSPMMKAMKLTEEPERSESPLPIRKLVSRPRSMFIEGITITDADQGKLEKLWKLIGVDDRNGGTDLMILMGRDVMDSGVLGLPFDSRKWPETLWEAVDCLTDEDVNIVLYRCDNEEKDVIGDGTYNVPGFGPLPFCGLQGFMSVIQKVARSNDLGHALCGNLREGTWMMDYVTNRLRNLFPQEYPDLPNNMASLAAGLPHFATHHMRCWGRDVFISLRGLFLIPGHFDEARAHLVAFGSTLRHGVIPNLLDQGKFPRYNARDAAWWWLWGVQQYCAMSPEGLAFLGVSVKRRFPPIRRYRQGPDYLKVDESDEIPGDEGDIFVPVQMAYAHSSTIGQLCHEILERHARGINFREWNAGPNLDHAMTDAGFNMTSGTRFEDGTGFVYGGNRYNCGTWMDKMGDSEKAGTKGIPATPRDGSPVEIIGLLKAALRWIVKDVLNSECKAFFPSDHVVLKSGSNKILMYRDWDEMVAKSFEKYFYIPEDPRDDPNFELDEPKLINKRAIYKDVLGSSQKFTEFQLRPNFLVALVVAPELFDVKHACGALDIVGKHLLGPLGIKTLDPDDWAYRGFYDNANDSTDSAVAHGFNYHNGPEWGWLMGYYLMAYIHFKKLFASQEKVNQDVQRILLKHKKYILDHSTNLFAGLPELTNKDGIFCDHSCPTQAWSSASLLEVVFELQQK